MKRLVDKDNSFVSIEPNLNMEEFDQRNQDSQLMEEKAFSTKRANYYLYNPVKLKIKNEEVNIQMNYCTDPLCKWYGTEQATVSGKTRDKQKYVLNASDKDKGILCRDISIESDSNAPMVGNSSSVYSNWAIATEIKRLIDLSSVVDEVYTYHYDHCEVKSKKPNKKNTIDRKKGINKNNGGIFYATERDSKSIKYTCVKCNYIVSVKAKNRDKYLPNQKVDKTLKIINNILTRKAVRGTVENHKIGTQQYYDKIKVFYQKCLEFLEKHETRTFKDKQFDELWLTTDFLEFTPNFQRDNGHGGEYNKIVKSRFKAK